MQNANTLPRYSITAGRNVVSLVALRAATAGKQIVIIVIIGAVDSRKGCGRRMTETLSDNIAVCFNRVYI